MRTILTVTGPTCSGKNHLQERLLENGFNSLVSFTTRPQREKEVEGIDYYFIKPEDFSWANRHLYAESQEVNGYQYGILANEVWKKIVDDKPMVAIVEPHGMGQLNDFCGRHEVKHISVYIGNPLEVLLERFLERYRNDNNRNKEVYAKRIMHMMDEENSWKFFEYDLQFNTYDEANSDYVLEIITAKVYNND